MEMRPMSKKKDTRPIEEQLVDALNKQSIKTEQMISSIQELTKWIKVTSHAEVGKILSEQVRSESQKIVYSSSDGKRTTKELFERSGCTQLMYLRTGKSGQEWA